MARSKITVVGAGNVGATLVQRLAERDYADIVVVDIVEGLPQGKALDLLESGPIAGYDSRVTGANGYAETAGSDIVVVTSGLPRKPGMSRDDLVMSNAKIVAGVVRKAVAVSPGCILIVVSNPVDAMAQLALRVSGFPRRAPRLCRWSTRSCSTLVRCCRARCTWTVSTGSEACSPVCPAAWAPAGSWRSSTSLCRRTSAMRCIARLSPCVRSWRSWNN